MKIETWEDVEDILFDGTKNEIESLRCPECGGALTFSFAKSVMASTLSCNNCGMTTRAHGVHYVPNAVKYFGNKKVLGGDSDGQL